MKTTQLTKWLFATVLSIQILTTGCHRGYYRRQADNEAKRLVSEKNTDPRWNYADGSVEIDPQSRMFDPFSQDHPPVPPDDAASHQFMHKVDDLDGYPHWHANGDTDFTENPEWQNYLPFNDQGQVVLDFQTAFTLAKIHSTDFQQQRETLYLSALDTSLDRFGFESQLFAGFNSFFSTQGRLRGAGSASRLTTGLGANGQGITWSKLGTTGANFAVGLANSIIWNFAGANTQSANSLIDFSIIQPLLRNAGRDRIMESLTQAERTLLANVRQMDRFRRGFYLEIITGRNAGAGPNAAGNFLNSPGNANSTAGGYLGLLQQQQQIRIQELQLRQLENTLDQFREYYDRQRIDALQVFQQETTYYSSQNGLLAAKIAYQNSVDNFKRLLGLPPGLDVIISDPFLDRFKFISDELTIRTNELYELKTITGEAVIDASDLIKSEDDKYSNSVSSSFDQIETNVATAIEMINKLLGDDTAEIEQDIAKLAEVRPRRLAYFRQLRENLDKYETLSELGPELLSDKSVAQPATLKIRLTKSQTNAEGIKLTLQNIANNLKDVAAKRQALDDEAFVAPLTTILEQVPESLALMSGVIVEFSLLQAQARSDAIELAEVNMTDRQAIAIARCFRRDWMNARANLVDNWRQIEFVADQLEAQVDLVFEGDIGNTGSNPFRLRFENNQLRAGLRFDAPIVRLSERNNYRRTLIQYQQSKRSFYQFRDDIHLSLRQTLRQLEVNKALFEINRKSVQSAIKQLDNAQLTVNKPPRPGQQSQLGNTASTDLSRSINQLQNAQLAFLRSWVSFEVSRRNLDFDMGTMQLDDTGRWIDPGDIDASIAGRAASMMGIDIDCQFCNQTAMYDSPFVNVADELGFEEPLSDSEIAPFELPSAVETDLDPAPTADPPTNNPRPAGTDQPSTPPADIPKPQRPDFRPASSSEISIFEATEDEISPSNANEGEPTDRPFLIESDESFERPAEDESRPYDLDSSYPSQTHRASVPSRQRESEGPKTTREAQLEHNNPLDFQPDDISFSTTSAGQFKSLPRQKPGMKTRPAGGDSSDPTRLAAGGDIRFSDLPGYQLLKVAPVAIAPGSPVVEESLIRNSQDSTSLRPISATIDQLPWNAAQTNHLESQDSSQWNSKQARPKRPIETPTDSLKPILLEPIRNTRIQNIPRKQPKTNRSSANFQNPLRK